MENVNNVCIPTKICSVYSKPFWNKHLTNLDNSLRELRKRVNRTSTPGNLAAVKDARKKFKKVVETAASNWTKQKLLDFNSAHHGNEFWKNFKKIFSNERDTMIAPLKCKYGLCFTAKEKTDVLVDTFFSGKHSNEKDFGQNFEQMTHQEIELIRQLEQKQERDSFWYNEDVQLHELENVIDKLHHNTSFDENNFHPKMIVRSVPNFCICLVNLFSSCLTNSQWSWTESRVLFIKKPSKPDYTNPSAYRPLCMSSHIGKMFERILNNRSKTFLMNTNLFDHEQEGFLPKRVLHVHCTDSKLNTNTYGRQKESCSH